MITIVITTRNRPEYIERQLKYYRHQNYSGKIIIGDASENKDAELNKNNIKIFKKNLNIEYVSQKNYSVPKSLYELSKIIDTEFCVSVADGGFLITANLSKCTDYLKKNIDCSAVHGKALMFSFINDGPYSDAIQSIQDYKLPQSLENNASDRWSNFMKNYAVPMYCVVRSDIYRSMWAGMDKIKNPSLAGELVPASIMVISGRIVELDFLYLVRHIHKKRTNLPTFYDWIVTKDWSQSFQIAKKTIIKKILENDDLNDKIVVKKVDDAFKYFFLKIFIKYIVTQGNGKDHDILIKYLYLIKNTKKILSEYLNNYPKFKKMLKLIDKRKKLVNVGNLDNRHKFYNDFYPVHQILVNDQS